MPPPAKYIPRHALSGQCPRQVGRKMREVATCDQSSRRMYRSMRSLRAFLVFAALYAWFAVTMLNAGPGTTWEHHPYGGPFIMLKQSHSIDDFAFCAPWLLAIGVPALMWIRNGTAGWLTLTLAAAALTSWLSWLFACWASC